MLRRFTRGGVPVLNRRVADAGVQGEARQHRHDHHIGAEGAVNAEVLHRHQPGKQGDGQEGQALDQHIAHRVAKAGLQGFFSA